MIWLVGCAPITLDLRGDTGLPEAPQPKWQVQGESAGQMVGLDLHLAGDELVVVADDAVALHAVTQGTAAFSDGRLLVDAPGLAAAAVVGDQLALGMPELEAVYLVAVDTDGVVGATAGTELAPDDAEGFGAAVEALDLDGDGLDELACGAPDDAWGYGRTTIHDDDLATTLVRVTGSWSSDGLGDSMASGDIDGDGYDDLVTCGTSAPDYNADDAGLCGVVPGGSEDIDGALAHAGPTVRGLEDDVRLGTTLAVGDVDGDGRDDTLLGTDVGVAWLLHDWDVDEVDEGQAIEAQAALSLGPRGVLVQRDGEVVLQDSASWSGQPGEALGDSAIWLGDQLLVGSASWSSREQRRGRTLTLD